MKKSFTLIEILVVSTIIVLLTSIAAVSYSQFLKSSRDARRKTDLEQVRAALEMYRSNSDTSSYPPGDWSSLTGTLTPTYMQSLPTDPKTVNNYTYSALPADCDNSTIYCNSYSISTNLESGVIYTVGPYGSSTLTPTPTPPPH